MQASVASASNRSPWRWATAGALGGLLLTGLLFAPARWLAPAIDQASAGRLQLHDARGTVWSGSARLNLSGGAGSLDATTLPGRLAWTLKPQWGQISARIDSDCCTGSTVQLTLTPLGAGLRIAVLRGRISLPASLLAGLGTPWNTLQVAGRLELTSDDLVVDLVRGELGMTGQAQLKANDVSSRLSPLQPLGSYRLTLQGGGTPGIELETLEGSLLLEGRGRWTGSRWQFNGTASARPDRIEALSNLMNIIGRRNGAQSIISLV